MTSALKHLHLLSFLPTSSVHKAYHRTLTRTQPTIISFCKTKYRYALQSRSPFQNVSATRAMSSNTFRTPALTMPSTTVFQRFPFTKVQYRQPKDSNCQFTDVPDRFKFALRELEIKEWTEFNKKAAKIWTGQNVKEVKDRHVWYLKSFAEDSDCRKYQGEAELRSAFRQFVLDILNIVTQDSITWRFGVRQKLSCEHFSREPDIRCEPTDEESSCSQTQDNVELPMVNGEIKVPSCLYLGSGLTPEWLQRKFQASDFLDNERLKPFFQALSYGMYTSKGLAFLTNYDVIRFFKINIGDKELLMSPAVKIDQVLDEKLEIPHTAQTLLYMEEMEFPGRDKFSNILAAKLLEEGDRKANEYREAQEQNEKYKKENENESSRGSSSKQRGSSSGDKKGKKHADGGSREIFTPVSRVLQKCKVIGTVGAGVTGELSECDFNGLKVAVKVGQRMSHKDVRDCLFHVKHEVSMYKVLEKLQGRVIPRVVIAGLERYYTPCAMVLITEKVGCCVLEENDGKIYVDGEVLDKENLKLLEEKGLEGLKKLHEHSVVHYDTGARNTRVEFKKGKIDRVWWIDFGDACQIDEEAEMVWDVEGYRGDYSKDLAIETDVGVFRASIRRALKALES